ncbi:hypothetical protein N658DRAFT_38919 [Parathielavia hyrcaniae]|uniref:Uncharacterized protein n=1 Tax=Parathielavia hyrcaniae TaxID=113614 RepID=A0AAN6Q1E1_9PEZI|nr:hypothetical protein N658DRAFT_38919 [Parathielavia hyrcaniae]
MLRLRPTTISLTRTDVTEVVNRRRLRKLLECDDYEACAASSRADTDAIRITSQPTNIKSSSSHTAKATAEGYVGPGSSSPSDAYHRVHPLVVADLPLLLPSDKPFDEDICPPGASAGGQAPRADGVEHDGKEGSARRLELCIRPKRSLPIMATSSAGMAPDGTPGSSCLHNTPRNKARSGVLVGDPDLSPVCLPSSRLAPRGMSGAEWRQKAGPSTPQRTTSLGSAARLLSGPVRSAPTSPEPFEDSNFGPGFDGSQSDGSSPTPRLKVSRRLRVYNDSLPASWQPQTPQNLAEARHQRRRHGAYTAPARRSSPRPVQTPMTTTTRPRRGLGPRREPSPPGLQTPGFMGLYGGVENMGDGASLVDETFEEGT